MNFYSGISYDRDQFLINMKAYNPEDVLACFHRSKAYHGLPDNLTIYPDVFDLRYLKFKLNNGHYVPIESSADEWDSYPVRVYPIFKETDKEE